MKPRSGQYICMKMKKERIIVLCVFFSVACRGNDESSAQSIQSILQLTTQLQAHLDNNFELMRSDASIEEEDRELAQAIERKLSDKIEVIRELRDLIEDTLGHIQPSSETTIRTCCTIDTPHWSPVLGQVNFNEWCMDGDVLRENSAEEFIYPSQEIGNQFKEKFRRWKDVLKWIYFSSEEGILFTYPGYHNPCNPFDPRYRPWYVEATTPQYKDVVLVMDTSGSMNSDYLDTIYLNVAKEAAETVLDTLNPNDRVNIVAFNDDSRTPDAPSSIQDNDCYSTQLVLLTLPNKQLMKGFIRGLRASGETSYVKALTTAFELFENTPATEEKRDKALLMLTDGEPTDSNIQEIYDVIRTKNANLNNSVVVFTYGLGPEAEKAKDILTDMANQEFYDRDAGEVVPGPYTAVSNPGNLRLAMATFYDKFKYSDNQEEVLFLTPYLDAWDNGMNVPICTHVQRNYRLFGLMCIDHSLTDYFDGIPSYSAHSSSYAFVINKQLRAILHPLLSNPTAVSGDITSVPITSLEVSLGLHSTQFVNGSTGQVDLSSRIVQSKGDTYSEGVRVIRQDATYRWFPVTDTGYFLITVNPKGLQPYSVQWLGSEASTCQYHKEETGQEVCSLNGRIVSYESRVFFSSEAFSEYPYYRYTDRNSGIYCDYLLGRTLQNVWFKEDIKAIYSATASLDMFLTSNNHSVLYYELASVTGVHRIYPGMVVTEGYNPLQQNWFHRCRSSNDKLTLSFPEKNPLGLTVNGISFCKPLYYNSDNPDTDKNLFAVLNVMVELDTAWQFLTQDTEECQTKRCFIMNEAGIIILHSDWFGSRVSTFEAHIHVMNKEPRIAQELIRQNYAIAKECTEADFNQDRNNGPRIHKVWQITLGGSHVQRSWYNIHHIDGTNAFLVTTSEAPQSNDCCECSLPEKIDQCKGSCGDCFCPCFVTNLEEYEFCSGLLTLTTDSPVPCTPAAWSYSFDDLAQQESNRMVPNCRSTPHATTARATNAPSDDRGPEQSKQSKQDNNGTETGLIAGVAVAAAVIVVLVVAVTVVLCRRREVQTESTYLDIRPHGNPMYPVANVEQATLKESQENNISGQTTSSGLGNSDRMQEESDTSMSTSHSNSLHQVVDNTSQIEPTVEQLPLPQACASMPPENTVPHSTRNLSDAYLTCTQSTDTNTTPTNV